MIASCLAIVAFLLGMPQQAFALNLSQDVGTVSEGLAASFGGGGSGIMLFNNLIAFFVTRLLMLVGIIALFFIVKAGVNLINSTEEDKLAKARREIMGAVIAVVLAFLSERFVAAFYTAGGTGGVAASPAGIYAGSAILTSEVLGLINWALTLVAVLSVAVIIMSAVRVVASFGKEDGVTELRRTIFGVVSGLVLLMSTQFIKATFGLVDYQLPGIPSTVPIIVRGLILVNHMLAFLAAVAVAIVVYSGIMLIVNWGNEEQYTKSKALIVRVLIGLFIVFISWSLTLGVIWLVTP